MYKEQILWKNCTTVSCAKLAPNSTVHSQTITLSESSSRELAINFFESGSKKVAKAIQSMLCHSMVYSLQVN